jgi:endonuclease/exonuclease/phosphatase family metal-dependent hydrolase
MDLLRLFHISPKRLFLCCFILGSTAAEPLAEEVRLRLVAANLTSGSNQSYTPGHGARILDGIDPDIVMIQEFNFGTNSSSDLRAFVDGTFGSEFSYYREAGAQIPNGIISRYPIVESGEWEDPFVSNRDFAWARIDIPGDVDLWAVSVHLLTSSATTRRDEADRLVLSIRAKVPEADLLVIGGDFNSGTRTEALFGSLSSVVNTGGPYPVDQQGNANTNESRTKPYDGVYADADLNAFATGVVIGGMVFPNGLVVDTRLFEPLSAISPAQFYDSDRRNTMQHMAVVRDFLIPVPEPGMTALFATGALLLVPRRRPRR